MKANLPEVEVIEVENVPEGADAERVMENMIKQGAKLIIAASFGYLEPVLRVAQKYPDVKFVHPGGYKRAPNVTTYWASTPEAFYLMGMAAGMTTKTNKLGYVVALPISFFLANVNAFELGARSVNPKAETRVVFTGTFIDPAKEATAANALLEQGVDVLGVIVDSPISVVQTAEKRNAYSVGYHYIGVQKFAPKGWISGIAFTWGNLYTRFAKQVMDGTWKSEDILGGLGDDFLTIAPFGPAVPPDALKVVNAKKMEFIERQGAGLPGTDPRQQGRRAREGGRVLPAQRSPEDGLARGGRDRPAEVAAPITWGTARRHGNASTDVRSGGGPRLGVAALRSGREAAWRRSSREGSRRSG